MENEGKELKKGKNLLFWRNSNKEEGSEEGVNFKIALCFQKTTLKQFNSNI
jgi:hypothetical protein